MLSYLTDATAIWAVSLLTYALCFRKTTFHSLNRAVLLSTLFAGLLLPLWPQEVVQTVAQIPVYIQAPVARISTVKTIAIAEVTANVKPAFSVSLWTVYYAGCVVALLLYVHGASRLFRLTRSAQKRQFSGKSFYETGRPHAPFSLFGRTFLSDASRYSPANLNLILQHEARHGALAHSVDVVLLALMRIGLWFHPFIYLYDYFLKRVHEYQADAFARKQAQSYGYLLLQEATSNAFPLVHSFHRSPLKSRIVMLTKNASPALLKLQYLLLVPVLFLTVEACQKKEPVAVKTEKTPVGYASDTDFVFNGNRFYQKASMPFYWVADSNAAISADEAKGFKDVDTTQFTGEPAFYTLGDIYQMNDEPVYREDKVDVPARYTGPFKNAFEELLNRVQPALASLPNGKYTMTTSRLVVSKTGKLVLYQDYGITNVAIEVKMGETNLSSVIKDLPKQLPANIKNPVDTAIGAALAKGFDFSPALVQGKPVHSTLFELYDNSFRPVTIFVRNGKVSVVNEQDVAQTGLDDNQIMAQIAQIQADAARTQNEMRTTQKETLLADVEAIRQTVNRAQQDVGRSEVEANATIAKAKAAAAMIERKEAEIKRAEAVAAHWEALAKRIEAERSAKL